MAIYSLNHSAIGRSTHAAGTASAHTGYILRPRACTAVAGEHLPECGPGNAAAIRSWLDGQEANDRKNGRVVDKVRVAFPIELNADQQHALITDFGQRLTGGQVPWLAAIHNGSQDADNPHAHVIVRDRHIETGKRALGLSEKGSTDKIRELWETVANEHLQWAGRPERIDRRSLADQAEAARLVGDHEKAAQLDRAPTIHIGPNALAIEAKGLKPVSVPKPDGARIIDYPTIDKGRSRSDYNAEIIDLNQRKALRLAPSPKPQNIAQRIVDTQVSTDKEKELWRSLRKIDTDIERFEFISEMPPKVVTAYNAYSEAQWKIGGNRLLKSHEAKAWLEDRAGQKGFWRKLTEWPERQRKRTFITETEKWINEDDQKKRIIEQTAEYIKEYTGKKLAYDTAIISLPKLREEREKIHKRLMETDHLYRDLELWKQSEQDIEMLKIALQNDRREGVPTHTREFFKRVDLNRGLKAIDRLDDVSPEQRSALKARCVAYNEPKRPGHPRDAEIISRPSYGPKMGH